MLVNKTGTAIGWTPEMQVKVVMDSQPGEKWARTILCEVHELIGRD